MGNWIFLLIIGVLFIIAGIAALLNPFAASVTVSFIAGWSFIILGILQAVGAFMAEGWGGKLWTLLLGVVAFFAGISLVGNPLSGVVALSIILGIMFLTSGLFKLLVGFNIQDKTLKWCVVISGLISGLLGLTILTDIPGTATFALGVVLAIELLSNGVSAVALSLTSKSDVVEHPS